MDNERSDTSSIAPILIGVGTTLQIISLALVAIRISTRTRHGKDLYLHDWAVLVAEIISLPQLIFLILATTHGYGLPTSAVPLQNIITARRYVFVCQVVFFWSCTFVKLSVALLLLSLRPHNTGSLLWRCTLYTTILTLACSLVIITLTQFLACLPVSAYWDPLAMATAKCWPLHAISSTVITFSAVNIAADVLFTCMPLAFLVRLHQPRWQRVVIAALMSLGLLSSVVAILRTVVGLEMYAGKDQFRADAQTSLLALVELHVGVVAATVPTLKRFFEGVFGWLGRVVEEGGPDEEEVWKVFVVMGLVDSMDGMGGKGVGKLEVEEEDVV